VRAWETSRDVAAAWRRSVSSGVHPSVVISEYHADLDFGSRSIQHNLLADRNLQQQALFDAYTRVDARSRQAVLAVGPRTVMANSPALPEDPAVRDHRLKGVSAIAGARGFTSGAFVAPGINWLVATLYEAESFGFPQEAA
jgi:hypothetical protein